MTTTSWKNAVLLPTQSIIHAMRILDTSSLQIGLVVDDNQILVGTITDGDIRRGILRGVSLESPLQSIMNQTPTVTRSDASQAEIISLMRDKQIQHLPVVSNEGKIIGLHVLERILSPGIARDNVVVIMAGGLGSRLRPLTNECPKPMLRVGNRPILEVILRNCLHHGFQEFYFSVNYKREMIEDYFGDGTRWGAKIQYIRESHRMGTAGALTLLPNDPREAILVMNADVLTSVNCSQLLMFHEHTRAQATMCVRQYDYQIPYGVVRTNQDKLQAIDEKPIQRFFVNAGIYVVEPDALNLIPHGQYFDMPMLFNRLIEDKKETVVFPVHEYWQDIGQIDDFHQADADMPQVVR